MRFAIDSSSMIAIGRIGAEQRGQTRTSTANVRWRSLAQSRRRGRGAGGTAPGEFEQPGSSTTAPVLERPSARLGYPVPSSLGHQSSPEKGRPEDRPPMPAYGVMKYAPG